MHGLECASDFSVARPWILSMQNPSGSELQRLRREKRERVRYRLQEVGRGKRRFGVDPIEPATGRTFTPGK